MKVIGAKTGIGRRSLSTPMQWLKNSVHSEAFFKEGASFLDYGCGRGQDADRLGFDKYDPATFPDYPEKSYDRITCTYVLCILPDDDRKDALQSIYNLLNDDGLVLVSVRADLMRDKPGKDCIQRNVYLNTDITYSNKVFRCYFLDKQKLRAIIRNFNSKVWV